MSLVVDAPLFVAALIDGESTGVWALERLGDDHLVAPHHLAVEVANILRRAASTGDITSDVAALAHGDLVALQVAYFPYHPFADRIWELRHNVTPYDAWYVALAESLDAPLATLDRRLADAPGPLCTFLTPQESGDESDPA